MRLTANRLSHCLVTGPAQLLSAALLGGQPPGFAPDPFAEGPRVGGTGDGCGFRPGRSLTRGERLYDLVAADADLLGHAEGGVFEDERPNAVLLLSLDAELGDGLAQFAERRRGVVLTILQRPPCSATPESVVLSAQPVAE